MNVFETLREQVPLVRFVEPGKRGKAHCLAPGHQDNNPSMHVYEYHVHCFACGFHGDVTDVWAAQRGFGRPIDAALDLAREFGIELPEFSPEAKQKFHDRREKENSYLQQARACHRALEVHPDVREWWERRGFDEDYRERLLLGTNRDGTAAVIPFWHRGRVQGLIWRKLRDEPKYLYPKAEEFAGEHWPLFIPGPVRGGAFLVEGIVDALALVAVGEAAVAIGGTNIGPHQTDELEGLLGPLYILPDADAEGRRAGRRWAQDLYPKALLCPAEYGDDTKDVADLFQERGETLRDVLHELQSRSLDALDLALDEAPEGSAREQYRCARASVLPLLLRLEDKGEREAAIQDVANYLKLKAGQLRKAVAEQESSDPAEATREVDPQPDGERREAALKLLGSPDLLEKAVEDMAAMGHVGERATKKLALICAVSARAGNPIQPSTHAQSSAGKNALWDTTLSLLPPGMVVRRSGLSAKALFRTEANLTGAVLYLQEVGGSEDARYTIRILQSDGRLEYEATEKMPDGGLRNVVHQTEGPTVVVQTTTKNHLHPENETRVFPIYIDESEQQTGRIVGSILKEASGRGPDQEQQERIRQKWHDAIRLLEPADVTIPYAERIEVPSSPLRIRRDARRLIDVVGVIAWLHQHQRDRDTEGHILATEEDFHDALKLVSESLRRAWQTLTPSEERVLEAIRKLPEIQRTRNGFKRRELKVKEVSDRRVKEILKSLTDTGYLDCDGRQGPQGYTYTLVRDAEKISLGISLRPPPDNHESGVPKPNANGREDFARYRPVPESPEEGADEQEAGANGRNGHRPIEDGGLQEEHATRRTGEGNEGEEITDT